MKNRVSFVTWMANIHINLLTWRLGVLVGTDKAGNRYYREKKARAGMRERRWVLYNGEPEASKVPPEWHGWLHHTVKEPLGENSPFHKPWQKEHLPNPTGTLQAYRPPGHLFEGGERARATGDYEPWTPS
ncbi:NADH:ubiquinone oxidoreductase subunit NDUFA12 [Aerophototrophica crusticola]|uniref:NADH:ubiquinone oxidoreductase subunit NDUFA12 n=1 Tax=Aerophototrophica crusticola TaxID=1709002 RepID=A0A858R6Z3_9PROT|nr:NADH:ubiquinone oxidoreductase subunit NDUFA12 [Rhodospirillaceae bacterium B3]